MSAEGRYRMLLDFGAADDGQAARLAEAWAVTCAAEYGTTFGGVFRLSDGLPLQQQIYDEHPEFGCRFHGFEPRECGEHRTVGPHRAWCYDCSEWCYPKAPCVRCEIVTLRPASDDAS